MKAGLTTSLALHAVALGFGLITLSSPKPMELGSVESFPIDIVPIEEFSQSVQGDRHAPVAETPAPAPTRRTDAVENAQQVGDNTVDIPSPPTPEPRPRPVETAEAPPPAPTPPTPAPPTPEPAPQPPAPEPAPEPERQPEPKPEPAAEAAPAPQPPQEVAPEPVPETAVAEAPRPDNPQLPDSAPRPQARPQAQQAERTPDRREPERQRESRQTASSSSAEQDTRQLEDEVAALLNREKPSGGGAKRSTDQAALGGRQTTGSRLSQSEMDALRGQIQRCWNVPAGAADAQNLKVSVQFRLDRAGGLDGAPQIVAGGGGGGIERTAAESARRAVIRCAPYTLPVDKYDAWAEVIVHFDPRDMF